MKLGTALRASFIGVLVISSTILIVAGIANLGMSGLPRAILKLAPIMLVVGTSIGLMATKTPMHGCATSTIASMTMVVALIATTFAFDSPGPVAWIPLSAYLIGIPIGVCFGGIIMLGYAKIRSGNQTRRR